MTTDVTPIPRNTWDDLDHKIYDARIRRRLSLRATAREVGLSHVQVGRRLDKMFQHVTFAEVDQMRTERGHALDELDALNWELARTAASTDPPMILEALRALRECHAIERTRIQLFGLAVTPETTPADPAEINRLLDAYLQGVNDATDTAEREVG